MIINKIMNYNNITHKMKESSTFAMQFLKAILRLSARNKYTENVQTTHFNTQYTKYNYIEHSLLSHIVWTPCSSTITVKTLLISVLKNWMYKVACINMHFII